MAPIPTWTRRHWLAFESGWLLTLEAIELAEHVSQLQFLMWSHESIYLPANASDEDGQGFNILQGGAEVDGAGTQQEHPTYDRVGEEGFPASLEAEKQFRV